MLSLLFCGCAELAVALGEGGRSLQASNQQASRCIDVQPICPPGKHPICLCESDLSFKCGWVCASQ